METLFGKYKTKKVGIVGPTNVGKSTLFNLILGKKKALVKDFKGITRDFLVEEINLESVRFTLVDTAGISTKKDSFSKKLSQRVYSHLHEFDLILFILDQKSQSLYEAKDILMRIKKEGKPFMTVVNKVDDKKNNSFYSSSLNELGVDLVPAAFETKKGLSRIMNWIQTHPFLKTDLFSKLNELSNESPNQRSNQSCGSFLSESRVEKEEQGSKSIRLVLVGMPNVGKSRLKNKILGYQRMLVSSQEGTTFDPVKTCFQFNQFDYFLTDTAGIKKGFKSKKAVESLSTFFSNRALEESDIVLLVIDVLRQKISRQDLKIANLAFRSSKALILVLNKIDEEKGFKFKNQGLSLKEKMRESIKKEFHFFPNVPTFFTSAKTGFGIKKLFNEIEDISRQIQFKVSTSALNQFLRESVFKSNLDKGVLKNQFKFFYSTQTHHAPPGFIIFGKNSDKIQKNQKRFLIKNIQKKWNLNSVPLRLFFKEKR